MTRYLLALWLILFGLSIIAGILRLPSRLVIQWHQRQRQVNLWTQIMVAPSFQGG